LVAVGNIHLGAVKAPIDILGLSNGARSGLTGLSLVSRAATSRRAASRSTACCRARSTPTGCAHDARRGHQDRPALEALMAKRAAAIPAQRFGTADEFGAVLRVHVQPCTRAT